MRNRRSTFVLGALVAAGLVLTQAACTPGDGGSGGPIAFTTPLADSPATTETKKTSSGGKTSSGSKASGGSGKSTTAKSTDPILAGKRQVVIKPIPSFESIVVVDDRGRLSLTDGAAEHSLFVLSPVGGKYQIRTAKATGGKPSCLGIKSHGDQPLTVVAAACDSTRVGQLFTLAEQKAKDNGIPTYAISNRDAFLQVFPNGLIAEELGDAPLKTTFSFVDNGAAA